MKKIIFVLLLSLFFVGIADATKAADEKFFCNCAGTDKKVDGQACDTFVSSTVMKITCPTGCAQGTGECPAAGGTAGKGGGGTTPAADSSGKVVKLNNPLAGNVTDVNVIVGNIINAALGIMGALVLLMIVWGGFTWLTAAGNPEKVKSGANTIVWAILGAVVVLGSYFLLMTVLKALAG